MIDTEETFAGGFSLVEHPLPPRRLAAPLHRHSREDEYSFILEGRMGALLGDDVVYAEVGDLVHKPRDQWHTFWNAGDEPCRILEIIAPGGFENFFDELVDATAANGGAAGPRLARRARRALRHRVRLRSDSGPVRAVRSRLRRVAATSSPGGRRGRPPGAVVGAGQSVGQVSGGAAGPPPSGGGACRRCHHQ